MRLFKKFTRLLQLKRNQNKRIFNFSTMEINEPRIITEGSAKIFEEGNVFYNPVQEFNRDISICVLNTFLSIYHRELASKKIIHKKSRNNNSESPNKIRILEALSATGLRAIRYAKELEGYDEIVANDLMNEAVKMIKKNVEANGVEDKVVVSHSDAMTLMYTSTTPAKRFTVIDLDPYGTPNRFLDGAIQSLEEGGLLLVTATDMAVLAGNTPEACIVKYGSVPLRIKACHEMGLRILLRCIEGHANRYGRYIKPLLCLSIDFYIRVFVRVYTGQFQCKESCTKQSMVFQCTGCDSLSIQPLAVKKTKPDKPNSIKFSIPTGPIVSTHCEHCNFKHHMGGPIWSDPIHDLDFLKELMEFVKSEKGQKMGTFNRIFGMLNVVQEELLDVPLYYTVDQLCCTLKLTTIPILKIRSAILHENYRVSFSHAAKNSLKTDAPMSLIWDILRQWAKLNPVNPQRLQDGTPLKEILSKEPSKEYEFDFIHQNANPPSRKEALSRFPENPQEFWGPGKINTLMVDREKNLKNIRNQNKNKNKNKNNMKRKDGDSEKQLPDSKHIKTDDDIENAKGDVENVTQ